jgi:hypothetical protein
MLNDVVSPVPEAGTFPVPVHPKHTYLTPDPPLTGELTEQVTGWLSEYCVWPAGVGEPWAEFTSRVNIWTTKVPVIVPVPVRVNVSGLFVLEIRPLQLWNMYPAFAFAVRITEVPEAIHGPAGFDETVPSVAGLATSVSWYWVTHTHVSVEFCEIVKFTDVPEPVAGTSPVPVQPVHTYLVPLVPATGDVTEHVTGVLPL